jgi:Na+-translocating ferredoxin:NAD+ oxidoreductase subunit D
MSEARVESHPFVIAAGPHIHADVSTRSIMWTVNAALAPATLWGVYVFGYRAALVIAASIGGAMFAEWIAGRAAESKASLLDGSAFCTGLLLAMTLPPLVAPWMAFLGAVFAILIGKMIFGGLGYNLFNPALLGRAFMMATFPVSMTAGWAAPRAWFSGVDAVTTATPLAVLRERGMDAAMRLGDGASSSWLSLVVGFRAGSIGELSVLLVVAGGVALILKGIIKPTIPLSVIAGLVLTTAHTGAVGFHLLTGGVWLGAFFMATDYVTSPTTRNAQIIFGLLIGALTGVIRVYGGYPEGICYAILIANTLVPALNIWFKPPRPLAVGVPS